MPAAGTVVTLMKTPTIVEVFSMASASTPAAPATRATTNDHMSGCQMKPVFGRGFVIISASIAPVNRANSASSATTPTAKAKLSTSSRRLRPTSPHRANTIPTEAAAIALNSGPTTIAPTTRTAESVITAMAARITASTRKMTYDTVGWAPSSAWASTDSQMTASSGCPGASASRRDAAANGVESGVVSTMPPRSSSPSSLSWCRTTPAFSRATSHSTRSPSGSTQAPACTVTLVTHSPETSTSRTCSERSSGTVRRKWTSTADSVRPRTR